MPDQDPAKGDWLDRPATDKQMRAVRLAVTAAQKQPDEAAGELIAAAEKVNTIREANRFLTKYWTPLVLENEDPAARAKNRHYVDVTVPKRLVHVFEHTTHDGKKFRTISVLIPREWRIDGKSLEGYHLEQGLSKQYAAQLANKEKSLRLWLRTDRPVELFRRGAAADEHDHYDAREIAKAARDARDAYLRSRPRGRDDRAQAQQQAAQNEETRHQERQTRQTAPPQRREPVRDMFAGPAARQDAGDRQTRFEGEQFRAANMLTAAAAALGYSRALKVDRQDGKVGFYLATQFGHGAFVPVPDRFTQESISSLVQKTATDLGIIPQVDRIGRMTRTVLDAQKQAARKPATAIPGHIADRRIDLTKKDLREGLAQAGKESGEPNGSPDRRVSRQASR